MRWNTNEPVPGAVITVYRATEPRLPAGVTTTTDSSGVFTFEVAEGNYDIVVTVEPKRKALAAANAQLEAANPKLQAVHELVAELTAKLNKAGPSTQSRRPPGRGWITIGIFPVVVLRRLRVAPRFRQEALLAQRC